MSAQRIVVSGAEMAGGRKMITACALAALVLTVGAVFLEADRTLGVRLTATGAAALVGVTWTWRRLTPRHTGRHLVAAALLTVVSATVDAPLVVLPVAAIGAALAGWDLRSNARALGVGLAFTLTLVACLNPDHLGLGVVPALGLPPLAGWGAHQVRRFATGESIRREAAQVLGATLPETADVDEPHQVHAAVLTTACRLGSLGGSPVTRAVLVDRGLRTVVATEGEGAPSGRLNQAIPPVVQDAADASDIVVIAGEDAHAVSRWLAMPSSPVVVVIPLRREHALTGVVLVQAEAPPALATLTALSVLTPVGGTAIAEVEGADELAMTNYRFRGLVRDSADVMAITAPDGTIHYISPAVEPSWGHRPEGLIGRSLTTIVHPDDRALVAAYLTSAAVHDRVADELLIRVAAGRDGWRWVEIRARRLKPPPEPTCTRQGNRDEVVMNLRDVDEREELRGQLAHAALHDHLTGLPNRSLFRDRLALGLRSSGRTGQRTAVLFIDLDDFKVVNDTLGHEVGDQLLSAFAGRLRDCIRPGDTAARLGGDEFAIVLPVVEGEEEALAVAERVISCVGEPFLIADVRFEQKASVGVASGSEADGLDALLRFADIAMYQAKEAGGGRASAHRPEESTTPAARLRRTVELRRAIESGQVVPYFQPIVGLADGVISGLEALARWIHPTDGILPAGQFLSLAESSGQLHDLDVAILAAACAQARVWEQTEVTDSAPPLTVSVNLPARDLLRPRIVEELRLAIASAGLSPDRIILEVAQGVLLRDNPAVLHQLAALRAEGLRIAIDDFGAGHAVLGHLAELPVDILKLDRSFTDVIDGGVAGGRDRASIVARSIIDLSTQLGIQIVAGGIERAGQLAVLRQLACPLGQGFHLGRPVSGDEMRSLLSRGRQLTLSV